MVRHSCINNRMIFLSLDQGKDKLEWYRTVDAAKLEHLKEMMAADNYKENLGTLIRLECSNI